MNKKIYKLFSVLLAVIIVFSSFTVAINVTADTNNTKEFFVKTGADTANADGTKDNPFASIGDAVTYAVTEGYTQGDTVTLTVIDSTQASWGSFPQSFDFRLVIQTSSGIAAAAISLPAKACFAGDIEFKNINVNAGGAWPSRKVYFGGNNIKFAADASLNTDYAALGFENGNIELAGQNVIIEGGLKCNPTYIYLSNEVNGSVIQNGDVTLKLNSANGVISPSSNYGLTTFNNNINLDLTGVSSTKLIDFGSVGGWKMNGAVQIICKENITVTNDDLLTTCAPANGVYKIINSTGLDGLLEFSANTAGKYKLLADTERFTFTVKDTQSADYPVKTIENAKYVVLPATGGGNFTVTAQKQPEQKEYYISASGKSDNSGTKEEPFLTVADAVKAANVYGMTASDTVTVTVLGEAGVEWGVVPAYNFKMTLKSETEGTQAAVTMADKTALSGDVVFKDIKLNAKNLQFNDHDVTYERGTEHATEYPAFGTSNTPSIVNGQTVIYRGKIYAPYTKITNDASGAKTYTDDVNVIVDGADVSLGLYVKSNYGATVYEENANLNINVKNAKAVNFINAGGTITHNGAIQIIYKQGFQLSGRDLIDAVNPAKGVYWLIDNSGMNNLLEFTETVGKYKVNSQYEVIAVASEDLSEIKAENGYLTLAKAGEYVITVDRPAVVKDYYVDPEGITVETGTRPETAGTKENPVKTVSDAIRLIAQDPLNSLDQANIILPADKQSQWGTGAVNYAPKVVIKSNTENAVAMVLTSVGTAFTGNTCLESIKLVQQNSNAGIGFGHYNVTIDKASSIDSNYINIGGVTSPGTVTEDQNIEIYGVFDSMEFKLATGYGNTTYNNKINVLVDNPETTLNVRFGARTQTTTNYNGSIYLNIKNAEALSFDKIAADATVNMGGSIQLIVNKDVRVTYAVKTSFNKLVAAKGKWYVTNYSATPDLIDFGENAGEFKIKDNKKVYVRQYEVEKMDVYENGTVTLGDGEYVISDEKIPYLYNDSHKMLYFRNLGSLEDLYSRVAVTPGETYRFEYSIWCSRYEDLSPAVKQNGDYRWTLVVPEIISEEKIDNYYRVVCEATIPEDYNYPTAFFGVELFPFNEGYLFDTLVYNKNDTAKTDLMQNSNFHAGLDHWAVGYHFWGAIFTGEKGGTGRLEFDGITKLKVVTFSVETIQELINACSPNDGKWWKDNQLKEEVVRVPYANAVLGTLKNTDGEPLANHKIVLISAENTYTATTNAKGEFRFKDDIIAAYYDLIVITKNGKKVETGYAMFIEEHDTVTFDLVISYGNTLNDGDYETVDDSEPEEEYVASGTLTGTVYTPLLDVVPNLKVYIKGVGEAVTDQDGRFAFSNVPVGEYSLYTVLGNGDEYEFRKITIKENVKLDVKLKYDPPQTADGDGVNNGWIIWVIVASAVALVVIVGFIILLFIKKKKEE